MGQQPSLLLVDYDADRREAAWQAMRARGFDVHGVATPHHALAALRRQAFDLVVIGDQKPLPIARTLRDAGCRAGFVVLGPCPSWETWDQLARLGALDQLDPELGGDALAVRLRNAAAARAA